MSQVSFFDKYVMHVFLHFTESSKLWTRLKSFLYAHPDRQLPQTCGDEFFTYLTNLTIFLQNIVDKEYTNNSDLEKDFQAFFAFGQQFLQDVEQVEQATTPFTVPVYRIEEEDFQELDEKWKHLFQEMGVFFLIYFLKRCVLLFPLYLKTAQFIRTTMSDTQKYVFWLHCCRFIRDNQQPLPKKEAEAENDVSVLLQHWNEFYREWDSSQVNMFTSLASQWDVNNLHTPEQRSLKHTLLGKYPVFFASEHMLSVQQASQSLEGVLFLFLFFLCGSSTQAHTYPGDLVPSLYQDLVLLSSSSSDSDADFENEEDKELFQEFCEGLPKATEWSILFCLSQLIHSLRSFVEEVFEEDMKGFGAVVKQSKQEYELQNDLFELMQIAKMEVHEQNKHFSPSPSSSSSFVHKQKRKSKIEWVSPEEAKAENKYVLQKLLKKGLNLR